MIMQKKAGRNQSRKRCADALVVIDVLRGPELALVGDGTSEIGCKSACSKPVVMSRQWLGIAAALMADANAARHRYGHRAIADTDDDERSDVDAYVISRELNVRPHRHRMLVFKCGEQAA